MKGTYRERRGHRVLQASEPFSWARRRWPGEGGWRATGGFAGSGLHCRGTERLAAGLGKQSANAAQASKGEASASERCRLETRGGAKEMSDNTRYQKVICLKYSSQDLNFLVLPWCYQLKTIRGGRGTEPAHSSGVVVGVGDLVDLLHWI